MIEGARSVPHTPIQMPEGQMLPGTPSELREMANDALHSGQDTKAAHFYTMAIDLVARNMPRDKDGRASSADLFAWNCSSNGELAKLLSNRSLVYLKQGDAAAATEDADACTRADACFEKGHMRLMAALEAAGAPLKDQLAACERGLMACPDSTMLRTRQERLTKAVDAQPSDAQLQVEKLAEAATQPTIEETKRLADDPSDPRRAMAAADLGAALAVGAFGLDKDLSEAERYLRIGLGGGDVGAQRNLGLLLLEMGRPVEAAEELSAAAKAGDEQAAASLQQLAEESQAKEEEALRKLEHLAASGDTQAIEILMELRAQTK